MTNEDNIAAMLEGFNLKPEQIDEVMIQLHDFSKKQNKNEILDNEEQVLRDMLTQSDATLVKEDWRKRAALAAAIISKGLE